LKSKICNIVIPYNNSSISVPVYRKILHGTARFAFFYLCFRIWICNNRQCFDADPDPVQQFSQFGSGCGSRTRVLLAKNWKKFTAKIIDIFKIQSCNILIPRPSALKTEHSALQNVKCLSFFTFCGSCDQINADPWGSGTGSETLVIGPQRLFYQSAGMKLIFTQIVFIKSVFP
jgi:hypothetical protein